MLDLRKIKRNFEKKQLSASSASFSAKDFSLVAATETKIKVLSIPRDCLITKAYVITTVAGTGGHTLDLGYTGTENGLFDNADIDNTGVLASAALAVDTGTGLDIIVSRNATLVAGDFKVIVEYIEYTKRTQEFTAVAAPKSK